MHFVFDNEVLRGRSWEADALYLGGDAPVFGKLYLSVTSFIFKRPVNGRELVFLRRELPLVVGAMAVADNRIVLKAQDGTYCFEFFSTVAEDLQQWVEKKTEAIRVVTKLGSSVLGSYEDYPHPFTEKHKSNDESKNHLFLYLGERVPVLQKPIRWNMEEVSIRIDDDLTQFSIGDWSYEETGDAISIDCDIFECGFFDDTESEFEFHFEIACLGTDLPGQYCDQVDNEKLKRKFKADKYVSYAFDEKEEFIAQDPFGLKGFYRIKWSLRHQSSR